MTRLYVSVFLLLLILSSTAMADSALTVEPPNWWTGMQSSQLQLMVHGKNIGLVDRVTVVAEGVNVTRLTPGDSHNHLFVDLTLTSAIKSGTKRIQFWREGQLIDKIEYDFKDRNPGSSSRQGFTQADVIYLITPDRFANGNESNDELPAYAEGVNRSAPGGRHGGDIAGVIDHLDYIAEMGFTQIWLNPVLENAQPEYSYHGYSITDFYTIDPRMGTNAEYLTLSRRAQARGVGLIMDVVLNHAGSGHRWMDDKPFADWINFSGKFSPTSHRRESLRDPHAADVDKKQFSDGWFVPTMPDLNQRNPYMANYLIQNTLWWIEFAGLSGLRVDTYSYSDTQFLSDWSARVMQEYPNFNIVGEEWSENPAVVAYWQKGVENFDGYLSYAPSMFDFPWQVAMRDALSKPEAWGSGMVELYEAISNDFLYADPFSLVVFPDNHDMSRIYTQLNENISLWRMAMVLTLTSRGIAQIYYGTEILMSNPGTDDHGVIRTDFPGGWPSDTVSGFSGKGLTQAQREAQRFLQKLLHWRQSSAAIHNGSLTHFAPQDGIYIYFRHLENESVMVVINHNEVERAVDLSRFTERLQGFNSAENIFTDEILILDTSLAAPAMSASVYELVR
ncbi:glycoside hydrolase family 13 protein [Gilvimarinus sp. SDUM040013]|uniref:Glycoside hydrolase family 13 protein n=1 Tax=Gilvimarinus gilvus TaxID=3058038 RepID=A0ABU4S1L6_9GAMM|nr:glycoside hydrolase family 13 protein [Gilvimarinus sp. SDUM040013]MDO3384447.1 glycoside hydrolase family 13 protein [Gilvimarinus sp. SDUM040013]MDX6851084.1 glycoside hydrolase family 13 protein [Gilvimarinus sp. SDUM040013]